MVMKNRNMVTSIPDGHVNSRWSCKFKMVMENRNMVTLIQGWSWKFRIQDGYEKSKYGHFNSRWSCKFTMVTLIQDGHGNSGWSCKFKMVMKIQDVVM